MIETAGDGNCGCHGVLEGSVFSAFSNVLFYYPLYFPQKSNRSILKEISNHWKKRVNFVIDSCVSIPDYMYKDLK